MALGQRSPTLCGGRPSSPCSPHLRALGPGVLRGALGERVTPRAGWTAGCPRGPRLQGGGLLIIRAASWGAAGGLPGLSLSLRRVRPAPLTRTQFRKPSPGIGHLHVPLAGLSDLVPPLRIRAQPIPSLRVLRGHPGLVGTHGAWPGEGGTGKQPLEPSVCHPSESTGSSQLLPVGLESPPTLPG